MTADLIGRPVRRARPGAVAALVAGGALLLSGCQVISPRQTDVMYDAADGVSVDVGAVQVRNLVVVADKKGGPGTISGAVANPGSTAVELTFATSETSSVKQKVEPGQTLNLSVGGAKVTLPVVDAAPGDVVVVTVGDAATGPAPVNVPVVPATGYYQGLGS